MGADERLNDAGDDDQNISGNQFHMLCPCEVSRTPLPLIDIIRNNIFSTKLLLLLKRDSLVVTLTITNQSFRRRVDFVFSPSLSKQRNET